VSEAAYFLGFDDPAYFSRMFRAHVGQSPRAFRNGHFGGGVPEDVNRQS
jgi:AraC family transcriptional activator of pobA